MLSQGELLKTVQERLLHAKVRISLDVHTHVMSGFQQAMAFRFEETSAASADSKQSAEAIVE